MSEADGVVRGNPPVMVHDVAGNAVLDPREPEKVLAIAEASRQSNDAKDAERQRLEGRQASGRGQGTSGSRSTTAQRQVTGKTSARKSSKTASKTSGKRGRSR